MKYSLTLQDMGTVVLGKIESGKLSKGDSLILMPNKVIKKLLLCFIVLILKLFCV